MNNFQHPKTYIMPKNKVLLLTLLSLAFMSITILSCEKTPEVAQEITGEYCTYRLGINGPVSSNISISADTTERADYIISNISGYPNSSNAFLDIRCDRLDDRLVIPEYTVLLGTGNTMNVIGEGEIKSDGSINLTITIIQTDESSYDLFLNSSQSNNIGSYSDELQTAVVKAGEVTFTLSGENANYNFVAITISENGCGITIDRQSVIDTESNQTYELEAELYFTSTGLIGTVQFSDNNWQSVESIDLELQ